MLADPRDAYALAEELIALGAIAELEECPPVEYARERLGGTIVDGHRKPLDPHAARLQIRQLVGRLREAGFEPGENQTLRVF